MKKFDVLDRQLNVHQNYLVEASAGTGKTFSIQNIVVRLLLGDIGKEHPPIPIHEILVVTFTKAAVRDLQIRIRTNIINVLQMLVGTKNDAPDYVLAIIESGPEAIERAQKLLQQAIFLFDQAQIFTIHSFCARMLRQYSMESGTGFHTEPDDKQFPVSELYQIVKDFFRTGINQNNYSTNQLAIILKNDPEQKKLLKGLQSIYTFEPQQTFQELFFQFESEMKDLKDSFGLSEKDLIEDFTAQFDLYRSYKSGQTKDDTLSKVILFASLFDKNKWTYDDFDLLIKDGVVWVEALNPNLLKNNASKKIPQLHFNDFTKILEQSLKHTVDQARSFPHLLARLTHDCQQLLIKVQNEEEKFSPDDLLKKMFEATQKNSFLEQIRKLFKVAIIDEFQDTDPLQWQIFNRLFISQNNVWEGNLYLVGDPKQSIYSFRQADIYTYLLAADTLGKEACFSLDTNYRSQPQLVQALNTLFSLQHQPELMTLPKTGQSLISPPVKHSSKNTSFDFKDHRGAIHFFMAEGEEKNTLNSAENAVFFPFILEEINNLIGISGLKYNQIAILVRDRFQALRLMEALNNNQIPFVNQRNSSLADSPALIPFMDVLRAVLRPMDLTAVKTALGGSLISWNHSQLNESDCDYPFILFQKFNNELHQNGFASFFQEFLDSIWLSDNVTVEERLLRREEGLEFFHDLQQIADLIIEHHHMEWENPEGIISFLDQFQLWKMNDDERIRRHEDPLKDGVKILTMHVSKGLEFDVVFALGLVNRSNATEDLIPVERNGRYILKPTLKNDEERKRFCEENDAEKMRQLYVALTRAKQRLYIPVHFFRDSLEWGEASPLDLFIAKLDQKKLPYEQLYELIKQQDFAPFIQFLETVGKANFMTYSISQAVNKLSYKHTFEKSIQPLLNAPKKVFVPNETLFITSFSSLPLTNWGSEHVDHKAPQDYSTNDKNIHTLPTSSEIGILFHSLLEKIKFSNYKDNASIDSAFIETCLKRSDLKEWIPVINKILMNTLNTQLKTSTECFYLSEIEEKNCYREMPFLFSIDQPLSIEGIILKDGFVKGVIDLFFCYNGKYYIVDWKSNWLGNSSEHYTKPYLEQAMKDNHYFIQAYLYQKAVQKYLDIADAKNFQESFGGIFYLFLRGLQPEHDTGIYFIS